MATDTKVANLVLNVLSQEQYDAAEKNENELYLIEGDESSPVISVNGKTGEVQLGASDVGARPDTWTPTAADVGARPDTWTPSAADVGAPTVAEVNDAIAAAVGAAIGGSY